MYFKEFSMGGEQSPTQLSRPCLWQTRSSLLSIFPGQDHLSSELTVC
jgi:hypothetical protein